MDITELGEFDLDGFMAGLKDGAETEALTNKVIKKQIILALDASNSMLGYKIGAVNDAVNKHSLLRLIYHIPRPATSFLHVLDVVADSKVAPELVQLPNRTVARIDPLPCHVNRMLKSNPSFQYLGIPTLPLKNQTFLFQSRKRTD